ncbi:MAG: response regulator, partial [Planctomycetota bacterium]
MRILVVEDDAKIASFLEKGLREVGFAVDVAPDGIEGLHLATTARHDAAIVDVMLPGLDGITLIERLREKCISTPVLILCAKRTVGDRIRGLQAGG